MHKFRWLFSPFIFFFSYKWNMCCLQTFKICNVVSFYHRKLMQEKPLVCDVSSGFAFDLRALNVECAKSIVCQFLENEQFSFVLLPWNSLGSWLFPCRFIPFCLSFSFILLVTKNQPNTQFIGISICQSCNEQMGIELKYDYRFH